MPLDIHFDTDINGVHDFADSFRKLGQHAHGVGTDVNAAKSNSAQDWGGRSGPAFRSAMTDFRGAADKLDGGAQKLGQGIDNYADQMNHVKSRLQQARNVAAQAGLRTSNTQILEPGPGPGAPGALPKNPTPQQQQAHTAACQAHAAHQAQ